MHIAACVTIKVQCYWLLVKPAAYCKIIGNEKMINGDVFFMSIVNNQSVEKEKKKTLTFRWIFFFKIYTNKSNEKRQFIFFS